MLNVIIRHMVCLVFAAILRSSHYTYAQPPLPVCVRTFHFMCFLDDDDFSTN